MYMTQPEQSGPGSINNNEAGGLSTDQERKVLSQEEIELMFNPSIPEFHGITASNPSLDDEIIGVSSVAELNDSVDFHMGEGFVPWETNPQMSQVHEALANGTKEEQELYEAIQSCYRTNRDAVDYIKLIQETEDDASLSENERNVKVQGYLDLLRKQDDLRDKKYQQVGSLFRGLVKIPRITEDGLHQFLNLDKNKDLKEQHIANLSDVIRSLRYDLDRVVAIKESQFLDEINEDDIRYGYQELVERLSILSSYYDETNNNHVQEKVELEKAILFFEKRFPYLLDNNEQPKKERSFSERIMRVGAFISSKWKGLFNRKPEEITEVTEPTVDEEIENPSSDAISPAESVEGTAADITVNTLDGGIKVASVESPEKVQVENPVEVKTSVRNWWRPKPAVSVEANEKGNVSPEITGDTASSPLEVDGLPTTDNKSKIEKQENVSEVPKREMLEGEAPAPVSPENKKAALARIFEKIEKSADWYNKQPKKVKFAVGAGLLVAGLTGAAVSSGAILGGVAAAKYTLRGVSAYAAGKGVEKMLDGKEYVKKAKWATMLGVFALGSYTGDILKSTGELLRDIIPDGIQDSLSNLFSSAKESVENFIKEKSSGGGSRLVKVPEAGTAGATIGNDVSQSPTGPASAPVSPSPVIHTPAPSSLFTSDGQLAPTQGYAFQGLDLNNHTPDLNAVSENIVEISAGDTLSEVMMDNISDQFPEFDNLTPKGQANFVYNILANLSPDQLQEIGVTSGDADIISPENKIDFSKLHEIAEKMKITYGGQEVSLLERAKLLK